MTDTNVQFPGLQEFREDPRAVMDKLEARYKSLTPEQLDEHFLTVTKTLNAAGVENQLTAVSSEDLQLAILWQRRKFSPLTNENLEITKAKKAKKSSTSSTSGDIDPLSEF